MKVCAVVVTYNRRELLRKCLQALLSQTTALDEIIVIDNASTDGTEEMIKSEFPQVTYVRLSENIGGAGGFHEGMKLAYEKGYGWIWAMDDDAVVDTRCLEYLLNDASRGYQALATRVYDSDNELEPRTLSSVIWNEYIFKRKRISLLGDDEIEVHSFPLLGLLVHRDLISKYGLVNPSFFIQADDLDFTLRITQCKPLLISKNTILIHHTSNKNILEKHKTLLGEKFFLKEEELWKDYYGFRNWIYIVKINLGLSKAIVFAFKSLFIKTIQWGLLRANWKATKMYWISAFHGLNGKLGKNPNYLPANAKKKDIDNT